MDRSNVHYKEKLQSVWGSIKKDVRLSDISDALVESGALSVELWEELKSPHLSEKDRMEKFLFALIKSNSVANFQAFVDALKKGGFGHISDKLQSIETCATNLHITGNGLQTHGTAADLKMIVTKVQHAVEKLDMVFEEKQEDWQKQKEERRKEEEYRRKEEEYRQEQEKYRRKEEEYRQKQKEDRQKEEEYRRKEEEYRQKQKEDRQKEEEYRRKEEEYRQEQEEYRRKQEERYDNFERILAEHENNKDILKEYELLKQNHEELQIELTEKEEKVKELQTKLDFLESNPQAQSEEKYTALQTQYIALKKTNEERVARLKDVNMRVQRCFKKYAETFNVQTPKELTELEEHFETAQDRMKTLKSDSNQLSEELQKIKEENKSLIKKNEELEEEMNIIDKRKNKIKKNSNNANATKCKNNTDLSVKGKKYR